MSEKEEVTISPTTTTDAFCVKCRVKHPIKDKKVEIMKNGKYAVKGQCDTCGKSVYKIVKTDEGRKLLADEKTA